MIRTILLALLFVVSVSCVPGYTFAQSGTTPPTTSETKPKQVERVATVNLTDAKVVQDGNKFNITFTISNRVGTQPGIKYGVMLVEKTVSGQVTADQYVFDETLTLSEGESVTRDVVYTAPAVLNGTYSLILSSKNVNGFPFGLSFLGDVTLASTAVAGVFVNTDTCYLTVEGDTTKTKYTPAQGVDISQTETLTSHCVLENMGNETLSVTPRMVAHERSLFGALAESVGGDTAPVTFKPKEKREVATKLSKASVPQAYDLALSYGEGGNSVIYRYVVQGGSGTIQNLVFDKNLYQSGETAKISFVWSDAADGFQNARAGTGTELTKPRVTIALQSGSGVACAESYVYELNANPVHQIQIPVTSECRNPRVNVVLKDDTFGDLSEIDYEIKSPDAPVVPAVPDTSVPPEKPSRAPWFILVGLIVLGAGTFALMKIMRDKKNTPPSVPPIAVLLLGLSLSLLSGIHTAHADTFTAWNTTGDLSRGVLYTVNLDKATYAPEENMTITASGIVSDDCGNPCDIPGQCRGIGLWVQEIDYVSVDPLQYIIPLTDGYESLGDSVFGVATRTAPVDAGAHIIVMGGTADNTENALLTVGSYEIEMYFDVVAPPNTPPTTNAGIDRAITLPVSTSTASGASAVDTDTPVTYLWSFVSGPSTPTITNGTTLTPALSAMTSPGTYIFRLTATDSLGASSNDTMSVVVSAGAVGCPSGTQGSCVLPNGTGGQTAGSCVSGYGGSCSFTCNGTTGIWEQNTNSCQAPNITLLELCDPGFLNCDSTSRLVATGTPLVVRWNATGSDSCQRSATPPADFSTGGAVSGSDDVTTSATPASVSDYSIVCTYGGIGGTADTGTVTAYNYPPPVLTVSDANVKVGESVVVSWDTNNASETSCTLTGGSLSSTLLNNGTDTGSEPSETGFASIVIDGRTTITLTCGSLSDTQVIEIVPTAGEL